MIYNFNEYDISDNKYNGFKYLEFVTQKNINIDKDATSNLRISS